RAAEIVRIEEAAKIEISGHAGEIQIRIAGAEVLLAHMGLELTLGLKKKIPGAAFEFFSSDDHRALEQVERGEVHVAIVTADVPAGLTSKTIAESKFLTCVGAGHPLHAAARTGRTLPVEDVLEHSFVSPSHPLLGRVGQKQSDDGWRDDQFPRKIEYW